MILQEDILHFSQLVKEDSNENIYPEVDANVKGIISMYGALSIMFEDSMPSTLNHHQPDSRKEWKWVALICVIILICVEKCQLSVI